MIHVLCTKTLAQVLSEKLPACEEEVALLDKWCLSFKEISSKMVILAMCTDIRFGFALWGVKKEQLRNLTGLVEEGIRNSLRFYGVAEDVIEGYLSGGLSFSLGTNRSDVSRLNRLARDLTAFSRDNTITEQFSTDIFRSINNIPRESAINSEGFFYPRDRMIELLGERFQKKAVCQKAYRLTATLDLERSMAVRTIIIPAEYSFKKLHYALQNAYNWMNAHLYEFDLGAETISCDEDEFSEEEVVLAGDVSLSSRLKAGDSFWYLYDFGDNWEVMIHVDELLTDYDKPYPVCTRCEGTAPPEDVGGVWGFQDFMEAFEDPSHPDHEEMVDWVGAYWSPIPEMKVINGKLRFYI